MKVFTGHSGFVNEVAFSKDGDYLFSASDDKSVGVWRVSSGRCLKRIGGHV